MRRPSKVNFSLTGAFERLRKDPSSGIHDSCPDRSTLSVGAFVGLVALLLVPIPAGVPGDQLTARAELVNRQGDRIGAVELEETAQGVLLRGSVSDLSSGVHAIHVHEIGICDPPFASAGGHFNPAEKSHGMRSDDGKHAGDLPNLIISQDGELSFEIFAHAISLESGSSSVLDDDGSAIVIHAEGDDHESQPSGDAGARVACGVITR